MLRYVANTSCLVAVVAACGSQTDQRPETAAYISAAILVPYCGRAACHSSDARAHDLAFDTVADSMSAMRSRTRSGQILVIPGDPTRSRLVTVLTDSSRIMPPDTPLPDADIDLITRWVSDGADGL
jgi:hypothetical protein